MQRHAAAIEYFETHDLSDDLGNMPEVQFEVNVELPSPVYYALEAELSRKLRAIARDRGISAGDLLNEWVQKKAAESLAVGAAE